MCVSVHARVYVRAGILIKKPLKFHEINLEVSRSQDAGRKKLSSLGGSTKRLSKIASDGICILSLNKSASYVCTTDVEWSQILNT